MENLSRIAARGACNVYGRLTRRNNPIWLRIIQMPLCWACLTSDRTRVVRQSFSFHSSFVCFERDIFGMLLRHRCENKMLFLRCVVRFAKAETASDCHAISATGVFIKFYQMVILRPVSGVAPFGTGVSRAEFDTSFLRSVFFAFRLILFVI